MIKLPRKQFKSPVKPTEPEKERSWPQGAIFNYDRFGSKIHINVNPRVQGVKDAFGNIIRKSNANPYLKRATPKPLKYLPDQYQREEYVYVDISKGVDYLDSMKGIDIEDLKASRWDEDFPSDEKE